jgi:16S rRNA (cytidine1402-2'-O)-methyltransferase
LSVSGTSDKTVVFEGFLSPKPGRRRSRCKELLDTGYGFVLYESPFRIVKLLTDLAEIDGERNVVVGRELTKLHEELVSGTAAEVLTDFAARQKILGEFAVYVSGKKRLTCIKE